MNMNGCKR